MTSTRPRVPLSALYALLALLFSWAAAFRIPATGDLVRIVVTPERVAAVPIGASWPDGVIRQPTPDLAECSDPPLRAGDRVLSVDGHPYRFRPDLDRRVAAAGPEGSLRVMVERSGSGEATRAIESTVRLRSLAAEEGAPALRLLVAVLGLFMPLLCFALGFWVVLVRPRDPVAWLVLLMLLGFSQTGGAQQGVHWAWPDALRLPGTLYRVFFASTWPLWFPLFGVFFQGRLDWERRRPWIPWLVLGPIAFFAARDVATAMAQAMDARDLAAALAPLDPLAPLELPFAIAAIGFFFFVMGWKAGTAASPDAKRRLRLLLYGAGVALTPMLGLLIAMPITKKSLETLPAPIVVPALLALAVFPISLAYVILVEKAIDARVAVRQGLRYAATRGAIRVLVAIGMVAALWNAWLLVNDPDANRPRKLQAIAIGMVAAVLLPRGAQRLFSWTDRRFFREAYDVERVLTELSEEVRTILETDRLLDTVLERIGSTLHVERIAVYLRDGSRFLPGRSRGYAQLPDVVVEPAVHALAEFAASGRAIRVHHDDPASPLRRSTMKEDVRVLLDALETELVLPLLGRRGILGFVALGPKKSEEPYSASDVKLLASLATQTGLALENSNLVAEVAHETARRERMSREIEIAREVQFKLFPQRIPQLAGIDCAGACRPAQGVGGDYYDFLALPGGRLGVALGDVAGKGIPAALLMASLQASLRGQRLSGPADLGQLVTNLNRLLYDASPDNRYATFFYGELDPILHRLDYVNAGHNAPMLLRGKNGGIERLAATGPVVGLIDSGRFEQRSVTLERGDLLVVYSDGISEAMNADDEEWGEAQLAATIGEDRARPAAALIQRLFEAADAFVAGAVQHDDMTLVVLRVAE